MPCISSAVSVKTIRREPAYACNGNSFRGGVSPRFTRRLRGQSTIEYVLIIAIIVLVILIVGPWVSSAIRNQFNLVAGTIGLGTTGENFYEPVDIPDPENGTAFAVYSADDNSLMFYKRRGVPKVGDMFNDRRVMAVYENFEDGFPENHGSYEAGPWHEYKDSVQTVRVVDGGIKPISISRWFGNFSNLKSFDISKLDMTACEKAYYLFFGCRNLENADLSNWNTPALTDVGGMFEQCNRLSSVALDGWNAPNVDNCWFLFHSTSLKTVDLSHVRFGKIVFSKSMFGANVYLETIKFGSGIDFSGTENMSLMFSYCRLLHLDCSEWTVSASALHENFNQGAPGVTLPKAWQ